MKLPTDGFEPLLSSPIWWLLLVLGAATVFAKSARGKGIIGEIRIRLAIHFFLDRKRYHSFHNLILPTPDGTTQIDHLVVSHFGIFVVETKNLKRWIFGDETSKNWTQSIFGEKHKFQNPLHQNFKHVRAVQTYLKIDEHKIYSVVVFLGKSQFKTPLPNNVVEASSFISFIKSKNQTLLSETQVRSLVLAIKSCKTRTSSGRSHIRNVKQNQKNPSCPRCGSAMLPRTAKKGANVGKKFWGCSQFPKCRAVREM